MSAIGHQLITENRISSVVKKGTTQYAVSSGDTIHYTVSGRVSRLRLVLIDSSRLTFQNWPVCELIWHVRTKKVKALAHNN